MKTNTFEWTVPEPSLSKVECRQHLLENKKRQRMTKHPYLKLDLDELQEKLIEKTYTLKNNRKELDPTLDFQALSKIIDLKSSYYNYQTAKKQFSTTISISITATIIAVLAFFFEYKDDNSNKSVDTTAVSAPR